MTPTIARMRELDDKLYRLGFPRTSGWWRDTLSTFYASGKRQLVLRVGRRGGKSSTLSRVAVCEAVGEHHVPPGDIGVVPFISVKREEAQKRLRTIREILDAIGEPYRPLQSGYELADYRTGFQVFTASIAGVSGPTSISVVGDEVSKWRDADTGANPATEVLASVRPTMATQPNARMFLSSSPMGRLDAHAKAFEMGDTAFQMVAFAPTWIANPTISEADTHVLEPDEDTWRREYAAIPMEQSESSLLTPGLLDRITRKAPETLPYQDGWEYVAQMDPATRGNGWTLVIATRRREGDRFRRVIVRLREWRGTSSRPLLPDVVLAEIAAELAPYHLTAVWSDQHHADSLMAIGRRIGLRVLVDTMSAPKVLDQAENLATWIADDEVEIPQHPQLRADLLSIRRVLTANGMTIRLAETPDGRHADYAAAVMGSLGRFLRVPSAADDRPAWKREQDAILARVQKKHGPKPDVPWWKRSA